MASDAAPKSNDSKLITWLVAITVLVLGAIVAGGFWMQAQKNAAQQQREEARTYRAYLESTREDVQPPQPVRPVTHPAEQEARATREYLLAHPAVTPGDGFNKPGVQATGKAIVEAIERAQQAKTAQK